MTTENLGKTLISMLINIQILLNYLPLYNIAKYILAVFFIYIIPNITNVKIPDMLELSVYMHNINIMLVKYTKLYMYVYA